jgi:DNA-binding response OmpR family regulator/anti-sigma regulatory factor (Ser/Thr protein kinase)
MTGPTAQLNPTILLADGDPKSREVFQSFFDRAGWRFDVASDPAAIGSALEGNDYDIVIADVAMPGADGLAMLAEILKQRPTQAIIAVSKDNSFEEALRFFRSGAMDLIARPIDFGWLERVVRQVIDGKVQDEKEKQLYRFVTSERTELRFTCRQLAELDTISLPILHRLELGKLLNQTASLKLRLAVQEAVVNALEHGNLELLSEWKEDLRSDGSDKFGAVRRERLCDPDYANRTVTVCSWFDGARLEISVRDQGKGFVAGSVGDATANDGGIVCSGRGLAMISSAVDEVKFTQNGSEVTMVKFISRNGA